MVSGNAGGGDFEGRKQDPGACTFCKCRTESPLCARCKIVFVFVSMTSKVNTRVEAESRITMGLSLCSSLGGFNFALEEEEEEFAREPSAPVSLRRDGFLEDDNLDAKSRSGENDL